jgi:hypothetical protein
MKFVKSIGKIAAVLIAGIGLLFFAARFNDGPVGIIPGGPFTSGEMTDFRVMKWQQFVHPETIELQLDGDDTSRTTWVVVRNSRAYIPASLGFPPGKSWHLRAKEDGHAVIRMAGDLYKVRLDLLSDSETEADLAKIVAKKYGGGPPSDAGVWFFRLRSMVPLPGFTEWAPLIGDDP